MKSIANKNAKFAIVKDRKYLPRSVAFSFAIYLKLIRLAMDAISVPRPPRFVPMIKA